MTKCCAPEIAITGIGVTSAIGQGKADFTSALMDGRHAFAIMQRPGRQKNTSFLGAEISGVTIPEKFSLRTLRTASFSAQIALATVHEAWQEARLEGVDPCRIGFIVGGSNFQQRELVRTYEAYADRLEFLRPPYGLSFLDTDVCGLCTEQFGIAGLAYTVGGASASGHLAVIAAIQAILSGHIDVCVATGALMDLSYMECQALRALGAMGSDHYAHEPQLACRPFDKNRDGFIFGESCGVVIVERLSSAEARNVRPYAIVRGWASVMDKNRNPNPSHEGEVHVVQKALADSGLCPQNIDYINPHGTGSSIGDDVELKALLDCQLGHAPINATKSIIGHGLSSAGIVEIIATLLQMRTSRLHPTRNLEDPIDDGFNWVRQKSEPHVVHHAINLSLGFGGLNTAICLSNCDRGEQVA